MNISIEIPDLALQRQPTNQTCVQTCLAMALSVPVEDVIKKYGGDPWNQAKLIYTLEDCNIFYNQFCFGALVFQGWYFAAVPSLNIIGGGHEILLRWTEKEGVFILDPSPNKTYDGSNFKYWSDLVAFIPGGKLSK